MAFSINEFRGSMRNEGARQHLFQVTITNPVNPAGDQLTPFMVRSTSVPTEVINPISIPYMGRDIKVPGSRPSYEDWSGTITNDENFIIRNALEEWMQRINGKEGNLRGTGNVYGTVRIIQYSKEGQIIRVYELVNAFPNSLSPISFDWSADDVEVYDVTFSYDYFRVSDGTTGNAGGI